ncbi:MULTISPECIES: hybrid sensor histidine kinase/response regulator [unclassified Pseudomonas]|uniref:hybrid sensor histidine kinase/response regulator n=1 Tax=unclassified Pseudomonas TaxID=196821 RepID=UPI0008383382|nr:MULTISPECIES: hybrid sensor histidine kinase/response regulator [unclassified Pseudomonas]QIH08235.1 response regulator [Pseudomonas sp. BIOMIG1BAC]
MNDSAVLLKSPARKPLCVYPVLLAPLSLALLLGTMYWTVARSIDEQSGNIRFHFTRLMEHIQEQELFLRRVAAYDPIDWSGRNTGDLHELSHLLAQSRDCENWNIPRSPTTSLALDPALRQIPRIFALGLQLSSLYQAFWSSSRNQTPRAFMFNSCGNLDIAALATQNDRNGSGHVASTAMLELGQATLEKGWPASHQVRWRQYPGSQALGLRPGMLAYINLHMGSAQRPFSANQGETRVASLLELDDIQNVERLKDSTAYDALTLVDPAGNILVGSREPTESLHEGLNVGWQGMTLKLTSHTPALWTGFYNISYRELYSQALWALASLLGLMAGAVACGWSASRWYRAWEQAPHPLAQQSVAESEAFNRTVIETSPTGLCVLGREDFKVLLENPLARQEAITSDLLALLEQDPQCIDGTESCLMIEGRYLQVRFAATRYQDQEAVLCVFNDITWQIKSAQALEQARSSADAANQAKALFVATMSHEIRTPLYGVLGTLELFGLTALDPRQADYLQTIQRSSGDLLQLISNVLDLSRIESGQMKIEPVEFCPLDLLEDLLRTHAALAEHHGILLYGCIDPGLPALLQGDAERIRQILGNLLDNALKFTDSGRVVLRARVLELDEQQASIEWQVTDTGIGISTEQQKHLFDPFYQVRDTSTQAGAGLGLAISRHLCALMEGHMQVTSEPGLGSSFSMRLQLPRLAGALPGLQSFPDGPPVYVRAPIPELLKNTCEWLERLGIQASAVPTDWDEQPQPPLLIDMLPRDTLVSWPGLCINAVGNASPGEPRTVDAHDIRAIAQAASRSRQGLPLPSAPRQPEALRLLNLHVLVAEDNPVNQAIILEQLHTLGCQVTQASNGAQALEHWQPQLFDLVLTDVNMPVMNGYELARQLRGQDLQLPIIGITANTLREEGQRCLAAGMNSWLVKPIDLQGLYEQLTRLCPVGAEKPSHPASPAPSQTASPPEEFLYGTTLATGEHIQISQRMRPLFLQTMDQDLRQLDRALHQGDLQAAAERLHSIAGGLGAVRASTLSRACAEMECRLLESPSNPQLVVQTRQLMRQLSELLSLLA